MINRTQIHTEFSELVGFRNENEITLTPSLNNSISGLYVNDLGGISLQDIHSAGFLKADLTHEETVSEYLEKIYNAEIDKMLLNFLAKKDKVLLLKNLAKNFDLINKSAYDFAEQTGDFVGFMFDFENSQTLVATIEAISLQVSEVQTVKLYLYETNQTAPIKTFDYVVSQPYDKILQEVTDWTIKYQDDNGSGLVFMLGYYEFDPDNILINHQLNETNKAYNIDFEFPQNQKDVLFSPIKIAKENWNFNTATGLYDLPKLDIVIMHNSRGLNARVSFDCDYTDLIIRYKSRFAEMLQIQLAKRIIEDCNFTNEFNHITESNRQNWASAILYYNNLLNGYEFTDEQGNSGRGRGIIDEVIISFEGIDKVCFPKRRNFVL